MGPAAAPPLGVGFPLDRLVDKRAVSALGLAGQRAAIADAIHDHLEEVTLKLPGIGDEIEPPAHKLVPTGS